MFNSPRALNGSFDSVFVVTFTAPDFGSRQQDLPFEPMELCLFEGRPCMAVRREEMLRPDPLQEAVSFEQCRHGLVGPAQGERDSPFCQEVESLLEGLGARRMQKVLFPAGLAFTGEAFRTPAPCLFFRDLERSESEEYELVALTDRLSNPLIVELTAFESLRTAVG